LAARDGTTSLVLRGVLKKGDSTNKEICEAAGLAESTVSRQVRVLSVGLVRKTVAPDERARYPKNEGLASSVLRSSNSGLKLTVERYVELWDL